MKAFKSVAFELFVILFIFENEAFSRAVLCNKQRTLANGKQLISLLGSISGKPNEANERLIKSKHLSDLSDSRSDSASRTMNNSSSNYSDYLSALGNNSQYYEEQSRGTTELYADLNAGSLTENLSANLINYDFSEQSNLNALPVNYYHENYAENYGENYSDLYNNGGSFSGSSSLYNGSSGRNSFNLNGKQHSHQALNRTSRRLFHRNSIICSSMNDKSTPNGENFATVQRPIDQIEELIANRTLFQADLSSATASPSIYSASASERNMLHTNSSSYDEQENASLYNNSTSLSPDAPHSLFKRSSLIGSSNETAVLPKLMPKYENGRFANPYGGWQDITVMRTVKFLLKPSKIGLPSKKELDITLPVVKPIISSEVPEDKLRVSWIGHATVLVQFENATILTDPHFSASSSPFKIGVKRYRPAPICVHELPDSVNVVLISHSHYDHLDYDSVIQLKKRFGKQITWFVPLGLKAWFTNLQIENVVELNWWQEHSLADLNDLKIVALPAQHWSRRGVFDENKTLWASWAVLGQKFRFYFAGDTGYNEQLFRTIGQEYGPFNLAAIPIGAYEPNDFLKFQHVNPAEAIYIHKDVKANMSLGIHWGTFPLSHENYLDPPKKLKELQDEIGMPRDRFLTFEHGETRLLNLDGTSKRENINRYAK